MMNDFFASYRDGGGCVAICGEIVLNVNFIS